MNLGLRFSFWSNEYDATRLGPTVLLPDREISFPASKPASFKDADPRLGVAYDLFTTGC